MIYLSDDSISLMDILSTDLIFSNGIFFDSPEIHPRDSKNYLVDVYIPEKSYHYHDSYKLAKMLTELVETHPLSERFQIKWTLYFYIYEKEWTEGFYTRLLTYHRMHQSDKDFMETLFYRTYQRKFFESNHAYLVIPKEGE